MLENVFVGKNGIIDNTSSLWYKLMRLLGYTDCRTYEKGTYIPVPDIILTLREAYSLTEITIPQMGQMGQENKPSKLDGLLGL